MSDKHPVFPLIWSRPDVAAPRKNRSPALGPIATPQTATRNAASNASANDLRDRQPQPLASKPYATAREQGQPVVPRQNALVSDAVRRTMVARVVRQGVKDALVLAALTAVPRHAFVQDGLASQAYIDAALPIGHQQTISKPYIVARMIEVMRASANLKRVLEIGTGCGYQAAVLARIALEVYSIERIKPLHELANLRLRRSTASSWPLPAWRCRKRCWSNWQSAVDW
jgi:protein-L-isoaspartate(D-aspartate) O-methyltransferase